MKILRPIMTMRKEDEGAILVFWALALVAVLGIVALSFDFGEKAATQSELQSHADQVALAAAGELDGKSDAITRATAAAAGLINDYQTFATGSHALDSSADYTLTFYSSLPASDTASMAADVTTNPAKAIYAKVVMTPRTVPFSFTGAFDALRGGTTANPTISASAVAGFTQYACDITPLMFCIPSPTFKADENVGKMILLRTGGTGAAWGPGDFGFLDLSEVVVDPKGPCAKENGANQTRCLLGAISPIRACWSIRGVDTEPGQKQGIETGGFNVRFDVFENSYKKYSNDANYAAAPNVIKGVAPKNASCAQYNTSANTVGLPLDTCFASGSCGGGGRFGDGVWSRANYVLKNYNNVDPFPSVTTRYQYYLHEINAHGGPASTAALLPSGKAETGRPICAAAQSSDVDRRTIVVAGIDCSSHPVSGKTTNIPVTEFVRMFLVDPVGLGNSTNHFDMYAEVIGSAQGGSGGLGSADGIVHDVVQLYR